MKRTLFILPITIVLAVSGLTACAQSQSATAQVITPSLTSEAERTPTSEPSVMLVPTLLPGLLSTEVFASDSPFCQSEIENSPFVLTCDQSGLTVTQVDDRRKVDVILFREYSIDADQIQLDVEVTSITAEDLEIDQNAYGFFLADADGNYQALRVQGQYFNFETWIMTATPEIEEQLNPSFSPFIRAAGSINHLRLVCADGFCEAYANEELIGRVQSNLGSTIQTVGIFTASAWDEEFGQVTFTDLTASENGDSLAQMQPYSLEDSLTSESGIFTGTGMSGAFSKYEEDGLHFSPVIPYGYYGTKAGISLENVEVSGTVKMEINPDKSGSQYAGLVCRSSQEGMYIAVIRVDGTYTIFRDTSGKPPFAVLAERRSDAILSGLMENELRLICEGDTISFYINDQMVESLSMADSRYDLNYGRAGIYTKAGGDPQVDSIVFSDLSIKEIE